MISPVGMKKKILNFVLKKISGPGYLSELKSFNSRWIFFQNRLGIFSWIFVRSKKSHVKKTNCCQITFLNSVKKFPVYLLVVSAGKNIIRTVKKNYCRYLYYENSIKEYFSSKNKVYIIYSFMLLAPFKSRKRKGVHDIFLELPYSTMQPPNLCNDFLCT